MNSTALSSSRTSPSGGESKAKDVSRVSIEKATVADLEIDLRKRVVKRAGKKIALQPRELVLLEYLARNAGRVVSKTMIMEHVWDYNFDPQTNVVESRICRLRDKIDKDFNPPLIHTVRGIGYVLTDTP